MTSKDEQGEATAYSKQTGGYMYGKLFASLYQGTLRGMAHEILVFTNLIAHADREGFVDKTAKTIAEEVGLTVDEVKAALLNLEAPDEESRSQEHGGRRLLRINEHRSWGWTLVNYKKYRDMKNEEMRRQQNRDAQAAWRARQRELDQATLGSRPPRDPRDPRDPGLTEGEGGVDVGQQASEGVSRRNPEPAYASSPRSQSTGLLDPIAACYELAKEAWAAAGRPVWGRDSGQTIKRNIRERAGTGDHVLFVEALKLWLNDPRQLQSDKGLSFAFFIKDLDDWMARAKPKKVASVVSLPSPCEDCGHPQSYHAGGACEFYRGAIGPQMGQDHCLAYRGRE